MTVTVRSAGFLTTVQDLGRVGFRQSGVTLGGALDRHTLRVANAVAANDESAAGLEVTLGNVRLHFADVRVVAWCGGGFEVRIAGTHFPPGHAGVVRPNEDLTMTAPETRARAWLAISGGIDVPPVLGSRSTDLRGNFGGFEGRALRDGDCLSLGDRSRVAQTIIQTFRSRRISDWSAPEAWSTTAARDRVLRIVRGADSFRFTAVAHTALVREPFTVTLDSDRMGVRLEGPSLPRHDRDELFSEAVAPGTLQVPPNGKPILLLGDCQTIGGYPKIAHVITVDLPIAAQLGPDDLVRFHEVSLAEAEKLLRKRESDFARFRIGLELRMP